MTDGTPLLSVRDLRVEFASRGRNLVAVDGVSFDVPAGASVGIVGESGSGKSVTAFTIAGLLQPPGRMTGGRVVFRGTDLSSLSEKALRGYRGNEIGMVFQEPMVALNPVMRVGDQIAEAILAHQSVSKRIARDKAVELLRAVGIPEATKRMRDYPNAMSGGMRQRVVIAIAMANSPSLLILDEPTTALDATVQAQIIDLVRKLREEHGTAVLLISHDIGVVSDFCDQVIVMYGGQVMERATGETLTADPRHPYSQGLLNSLPEGHHRDRPVVAIPGSVPAPADMPPGCPFANRCPSAFERCEESPPTTVLGSGHEARCWLLTEGSRHDQHA